MPGAHAPGSTAAWASAVQISVSLGDERFPNRHFSHQSHGDHGSSRLQNPPSLGQEAPAQHVPIKLPPALLARHPWRPLPLPPLASDLLLATVSASAEPPNSSTHVAGDTRV